MNRRDFFKGFAVIALASRIPLPAVAIVRLKEMAGQTIILRVSLPNAQWRKLTNGDSYVNFRKGFVK